MKNSSFIFLRLSIYLVAGMLFAFYFRFSKELVLISFCISFVFFLTAYIRAKKQLFRDSLTGIATFFLIFCLGLLTAFFSIPGNQSVHYVNQNIGKDPVFIKAVITEELKPTAFSERYLMDADRFYSEDISKSVKGKILLNIQYDSLKLADLRPGTEILLPWTPQEIQKPLNPFQFDYKDYMESLKVKKQISLPFSEIKITSRDRNDLFSHAWRIREHLIQNLKNEGFEKDELAVFQALILGQRRDISDKLYKNYAAAGAIHILAISGLHVGILLMLLNFLFKPLERFNTGKILKPVIIILLLWSFAFLTGFSASVVRAVCMFSFIAIGLHLKRKTSTLNSLFLSFFFLLLINPYYIFQIGFQLSYLAVLGIILLQPTIYGLFQTRIKLVDYFWKLTSVSLAAQIAVFPLNIYYFHQFPGMFLLSNLVVLPFLGLILGCGILVIALASLNILPAFLVDLFSFILNTMNLFIQKIANVEIMIFSGIDLSLFQNLSLYLILFSVLLLSRKINFYRIGILLISILLFQSSTIYNKYQIPESEIVIFHKTRESVLGIKSKDKLAILSDNRLNNTVFNDYLRERHIRDTIRKEIPEILNLNGRLTLVVDSTRNYNMNNFYPEILILRNSPKVNLDRLMKDLNPELVIADGSNYKYYVERWKQSLLKKEIPFHYTGEKGAYILKNED